jgi:hypothetical protein
MQRTQLIDAQSNCTYSRFTQERQNLVERSRDRYQAIAMPRLSQVQAKRAGK